MLTSCICDLGKSRVATQQAQADDQTSMGFNSTTTMVTLKRLIVNEEKYCSDRRKTS